MEDYAFAGLCCRCNSVGIFVAVEDVGSEKTTVGMEVAVVAHDLVGLPLVWRYDVDGGVQEAKGDHCADYHHRSRPWRKLRSSFVCDCAVSY